MVGRRGARLALVLAAVLVAQGCWFQAGYDAKRAGSNGGETAVTAATVAGLAPAWTVTGGVGGGLREPLVFGGTVYVRGNGSVVAVDTATGASRWAASIGGSAAPVLADNRLWVPETSNGCSLVPVDRGTGALGTRVTFGGPPLSGSLGFSLCIAGDAVSAGGRVATTWSYAGVTMAPHSGCPNFQVAANGSGLAAVNTASPATTEWTTGGLATSCTVTPPTPPPAFAQLSSDETTLFSPGTTGFGRCTLAGCGSGGSVPAGTTVVPVATVLATGDLAAAATDGRVLVLDPVTGAPRWTGTVGAPLAVPLAATSTTIFAAGTDGTVAAFPLAGCGAATCAPAWTATLPAAAADRPSVGADVLYVGGGDGTVTALPATGCGAATCTALWTGSVGAAVSAPPVIDGGALYVGTTSGTLTAFRLPA
jgi:hypothetical protein